MAKRDFRDLIEKRWGLGKFVCVGLDSDLERIPKSACNFVGWAIPHRVGTFRKFNKAIIEATADLVDAYKVNPAPYGKCSADGTTALKETIAMIHEIAPDVPVILDAKRGDTHDTNILYACADFDNMQADAITVNPYFGEKALRPFLERKEKGVFVLCLSSEEEAEEFQYLPVVIRKTERPEIEKFLGREVPHDVLLYEYVAFKTACLWNKNDNCNLMIGATHPDELREIRTAIGDRMMFLSPGIGMQGGNTCKAFTAGKNSEGTGLILSASRSIIYASRNEDFAEAARRETKKMAEEIHRARLTDGCRLYEGQASPL